MASRYSSEGQAHTAVLNRRIRMAGVMQQNKKAVQCHQQPGGEQVKAECLSTQARSPPSPNTDTKTTFSLYFS